MDEEKWVVFFSEFVSCREQLQEINEGIAGIVSAMGDLVECEKRIAESYSGAIEDSEQVSS